MKSKIKNILIFITLVYQVQAQSNSSGSMMNNLLLATPFSIENYSSNEFVVNTLADLSNPINAGKTACFQTVITLSSDFVLAENLTLKSCGGYLDIGIFTLTGVNTSVYGLADVMVIESSKGQLDGTWNAGTNLYAKNLGLKNDGLEYSTGNIAAGSRTLTVAGGMFTAADVGKFIAVYGADAGFVASNPQKSQNSLQTTIQAVTNHTTVVLADPATRTINNTIIWTGSDNFKAGKNLFFVKNQTSGNVLTFSEGLYFTSVVNYGRNLRLNTPVNGWYMGDGTDRHTITGAGVIRAIPHKLQKSRLLTIGNTHNYVLSINLEQDQKLHNYSGLPPANTGDDFNIVVYIRTAAYNGTIKDCSISHTEGTLMSSAGDLQFTNYIKGNNTINVQQRASNAANGDVSDVDGSVVLDNNGAFTYSTDLLDISTWQFEATRIARTGRKGRRHYQFSGLGFAGWSGLTTPRYWAYYYDENQVFLRKSGEQVFYHTYQYEDDVKYIRVKFEKVADVTLVNAQIRANLNPMGLVLQNVHLDAGGAHGLSNMPTNFLMDGGSIKNVGNVLPAYSSNTEDQRRGTQNQTFRNVLFKDGYTGYLNWVGTDGVVVDHCYFLGTTDPQRIRTTDGFTNALSADKARNDRTVNNLFYNAALDFGRSSYFANNTVIGGSLQITANGSELVDNRFHNVKVANIRYPDADRDYSKIKDATFTYDKTWEGFLLRDVNMGLILEDVSIEFNKKTRLTYLVDQTTSFEPIVLGKNGNKLFNNSPTPRFDYGGYLKNVSVSGARIDRSVRDYSLTAVYWPVTDYYNVYSESSMNLKYGLPKDRTFNDVVVDGRLQLDYDQYGNVLTTERPTHVFNRLKVTIPEGEFDWTNYGAYILRVKKKNVDLVFNDAVFDLQVTSDERGNYRKWMRLEQLGTTEFNRTTFKSASPKTIDLSTFPATLGAITFTDCVFENVTFIPRPGIDLIQTTSIPTTILDYASNEDFLVTDLNKSRNYTGAGASTWLLTTNVDDYATVGTSIELFNSGMGTVTLQGDAGITILNSGNGLTLSSTNRSGKLTKISPYTWLFSLYK
ncbi:hypothetical protein [Aureispira anguillae]|uniref:Uncharacterized protein n=1 Tax=Aureispira anguillae TaxID=2864201 RepID=A0A916DWS6_9BACT|nr:hypothetical protein [Aureispira anguillae]BDS14306.1 hypothetical protein AsAng_0050850 [Aureispira anguillae]